jgi:hypothetical protein
MKKGSHTCPGSIHPTKITVFVVNFSKPKPTLTF